jgi:hypothetical protein
MTARWYCWPKAHAAPLSHPLVALHRSYRRSRRIRRAIIIACISIGGIGAAVALPRMLYPPPVSSPHSGGGSSGSALPESRRETPISAAGTSTPIPEPGTAALLLPALAAIALWMRR